MTFALRPLLGIQRELQGLPRTMERFQKYLRTLSADGKKVDLPPLVRINPMGREHVTALLDEYLALGAERLAAEALAEVAPRLADVPGHFDVGLVVVDDLKGGWTNRWASELDLRFGSGAGAGDLPRWLERRWLTAVLWSSAPASALAVREAVLTAVHRAAHVQRHGPARSLRERMRQEGRVLADAGSAGPTLDADDLEYTREVLAPLLEATDERTAIECLFGDEAGRTLGFTARGLSPWAGVALALHDARRS